MQGFRLGGGSAAVIPRARVAQVSYAEAGGYGVLGESEHRQLPLFAPCGIDACPGDGQRVLLIPLEGGDAVAGVRCDVTGLEPGEVRIRSAGGAEICLRNSGEIVLNGVRISKAGEIRLPGE